MSDIKKIITTCTRDCPNTCGLEATVEDGRLVRLTGSKNHPLTRGLACHKTSKYIDRIYSKERITKPMRRGASGWREISWDEALDVIAEKMKTIRDDDGPEAILYYQGYGERTALKLLNKYFFNLFGGVTTLHGSLCGGTGQASQNLDLGNRISHDPLDHYNSKAMILWARNPATTQIGLVPIINDIKKKGGRIITIDPFRNRSAALSDVHIAPAPNMDAYLAMAAAKILIDRGAHDIDFLSNHSAGYDAYKAILDGYSIDELCCRAGVSKEDVEYIADTLITFKPTSILLGWGLHRHKDAHFTIRAIDALGAISGNIGVEGGGVSQGFEEYGPYDPKCWGDYLNPKRRTLLMPYVGQELLNAENPPIRMVYVTAANPVCMAPNSELVAEALKRMELVVYSGHFLDDTAELADVFLPATTFLEEYDVMASFGHNYVGPVNPAIKPVGDCRSEFQMFTELAKRFSFKDQYCKGADRWLAEICAPVKAWGGDLGELRHTPFRIPEPMAPYFDKVFPTPSGKFEFMTQFDGDLLKNDDENYPYALLSVAPFDYICSERTLADHPPLPKVRLHPAEAEKLGLTDGQPVMVKSHIGSVKALLCTDASTRRDCLITERGGWIKAGHGLNRLTAEMVSTVGNGTPYYDTRVTLCSV
ncbi:molybdopterin-containing oxidoreductase family protein [Desulfobacter curvatus]|uniref:molybdopterin-containing oxidoreductase family protein n=1 Tax=Desulfobacter curvatus TaxID=2290 RepID=UPI0003607EFD|nr:molybdopterin-dependent oxidoreductase [Desulfobacter curvatus]